MITKENFYYSPINKLSFIDNLTFYSKLVLFTVVFVILITVSLLLGKIIPIIEKWLPVLFHKMLLWLLSVEVEIVGEIDQSKKSSVSWSPQTKPTHQAKKAYARLRKSLTRTTVNIRIRCVEVECEFTRPSGPLCHKYHSGREGRSNEAT